MKVLRLMPCLLVIFSLVTPARGEEDPFMPAPMKGRDSAPVERDYAPVEEAPAPPPMPRMPDPPAETAPPPEVFSGFVKESKEECEIVTTKSGGHQVVRAIYPTCPPAPSYAPSARRSASRPVSRSRYRGGRSRVLYSGRTLSPAEFTRLLNMQGIDLLDRVRKAEKTLLYLKSDMGEVKGTVRGLSASVDELKKTVAGLETSEGLKGLPDRVSKLEGSEAERQTAFDTFLADSSKIVTDAADEVKKAAGITGRDTRAVRGEVNRVSIHVGWLWLFLILVGAAAVLSLLVSVFGMIFTPRFVYIVLGVAAVLAVIILLIILF